MDSEDVLFALRCQDLITCYSDRFSEPCPTELISMTDEYRMAVTNEEGCVGSIGLDIKKLKEALLEKLQKYELDAEVEPPSLPVQPVLASLESASSKASTETNRKKHSVFQPQQMQQINEYLWIGPFQPLNNQGRELQANGITAVLSATTKDVGKLPACVKRRLWLGIRDYESGQVLDFDKVVSFVREEKECGGRVFVHCGAGVSRSAACCLAALAELERLPLLAAHRLVLSKRRVTMPNAGFRRQLEERYNGGAPIEWERSRATGRTGEETTGKAGGFHSLVDMLSV